MFQKSLLFLILLGLMTSCKQDPKANTEAGVLPGDSTAITTSPEGVSYPGESETSRNYCFASRTPTPEAFGDTYNYEFIRFHIGEDGNVTGTLINAPYGTDGSRGSLTGVYRKDGDLVQTTTTYLAEGTLYEEQRDYLIGAEGLSILDADRKPVSTLPAVTCEQYEASMREFTQGILQRRINTTDRSRLKRVEEVANLGYSAEQLDQLRFMEVAVDLDNDYQTEEYLLYIMDPMLCGSGGCNLLVIDGNGNTLSNTTVVKLPVYMPTQTIEDMDSKGTWKPLFVWSRGFRQLTAGDAGYTDNASMAQEIPEEALTGHPEKYQVILDYLD